jgi:hypothetical protein
VNAMVKLTLLALFLCAMFAAADFARAQSQTVAGMPHSSCTRGMR